MLLTGLAADEFRSFPNRRCRRNIKRPIDFVRATWGEKSEGKLKATVIKVLIQISHQPYLFKASSFDNNLRKGFISKQTSFFYEIREDHIMVLYFWDNRQQPIIE